eukprot:1192076-Prorocentrum_minimum.AAC.1
MRRSTPAPPLYFPTPPLPFRIENSSSTTGYLIQRTQSHDVRGNILGIYPTVEPTARGHQREYTLTWWAALGGGADRSARCTLYIHTNKPYIDTSSIRV